MNNSIKKLIKKIVLICNTIISMLVLCSLRASAQYELLESTDPVVRMHEIQRLGNEQITEAVPFIIQMLEDDSSGVRINAAVALGQLGDENAAGPLIEIMKNDPSRAVRIMAAQSLGRFRDEEVIEELSAAAEGEDEMVGSAAVRSIGRMGGEKAKEKLLKQAEKTKNSKIKKTAVNSLLEHSDLGANEREVKKIEKILNEMKREKDPENKKLMKRAEKMLEEIKKKREKINKKKEDEKSN